MDKKHMKSKMKSKYKWYHCKMWKGLLSINDKDYDTYRKRALELNYSYGHWCCFSDKDHEVVKEFDRRKKLGKDIIYQYNTTEDMFASLHNKPTTEKHIGEDQYGNKIIEVKKK